MRAPAQPTSPLPPRGGWGSVVRFWRWITRSTRELGFRAMLENVVATLDHYAFDVRYGTQTRASVALRTLDITSANKERGVGYQPSTGALFHRIMQHLDAPPGGVFVDVGCGKGRVLLMATCYPFARVVGVEFSPTLCDVARRNVEVFRRRTRTPVSIEIIESDIADYEIEGDQNVFYLFNPFDSVLMRTLLDRIDASRRRCPRQVWLIYLYPTRRVIIESESTFTPVHTVHYGGVDIVLYRSRS